MFAPQEKLVLRVFASKKAACSVSVETKKTKAEKHIKTCLPPRNTTFVNLSAPLGVRLEAILEPRAIGADGLLASWHNRRSCREREQRKPHT